MSPLTRIGTAAAAYLLTTGGGGGLGLGMIKTPFVSPNSAGSEGEEGEDVDVWAQGGNIDRTVSMNGDRQTDRHVEAKQQQRGQDGEEQPRQAVNDSPIDTMAEAQTHESN